MFKDLKDKIDSFGRELETVQIRKQMEILGVRNAMN